MSRKVPKVQKRTRRQIESISRSFLEKHFPGMLTTPQPLDVIEVWEILHDEYGLKTGVGELSHGVSGMCWPDGRLLVDEETYRRVVKGRGRARFTMCHEAGHGLMHAAELRHLMTSTESMVLYSRRNLRPNVDPEWQANQFAASILMPVDAMKMVLDEAAGREISDTIYYFKVSRIAAELRINNLRRRGLV